MGTEPLPSREQPAWLDDLVGMSYYGLTVTDAYLATADERKRRQYGFDQPVVVLEVEKKSGRPWSGYWAHFSRSREPLGDWTWFGGSVKELYRKALDEVVRPNYDAD